MKAYLPYRRSLCKLFDFFAFDAYGEAHTSLCPHLSLYNCFNDHTTTSHGLSNHHCYLFSILDSCPTLDSLDKNLYLDLQGRSLPHCIRPQDVLHLVHPTNTKNTHHSNTNTHYILRQKIQLDHHFSHVLFILLVFFNIFLHHPKCQRRHLILSCISNLIDLCHAINKSKCNLERLLHDTSKDMLVKYTFVNRV